MEKPSNVKELFLPLGVSLYKFESGSYIDKTTITFYHGGEEFYDSYSGMIAEIAK